MATTPQITLTETLSGVGSQTDTVGDPGLTVNVNEGGGGSGGGGGLVQIDQTTPGTTNGVTVNGTVTLLPANVTSLTPPTAAAIGAAVPTAAAIATAVAAAMNGETQPVSGTVSITGSQVTALTPPTAAAIGAAVPTAAAIGAAVAAPTAAAIGAAVAAPTAAAIAAAQAATTQPVSIATAPVLVAGTAVIGKVGIDQTTPGTTNNVIMSDRVATGNITAINATPLLAASANSAVVIATNGASNVGMIVSGTFSASLHCEGTVDGTNWLQLPIYFYTSSGITQSTNFGSSLQAGYTPCVGMTQVRISANTFTSGTVVATLNATSSSSTVPGVVSAGLAGVNVSQVGGTAAVNGGLAGSLAIGGTAANGAAPTSNPVFVGGETLPAAQAILTAAKVAYLPITLSSQVAVKPYGDASFDWQYTGSLTTTTAVAAKAAAAAGVRNYMTGLQIVNNAATATTVTVLDGSTVIWSGALPATIGASLIVTFPTPLKGSAATAMNLNLSVASTVVANVQGYTGF